MASWSTRTSRKLTTPEHTDRALDQMTVVRPSHPGKGRGITSSWLLKTIGGLHDSLRREMRRKREAAALVCSNADPGQDQEAQSTLRQSFDSQGDRKPCNGDDHQKPQLAIQQNDGEKIHQTTGTGETGSQELHETLLQNAGSPIHQSSGENGSSSQVLESTRQQKPQTLAIHQINGENMSSSQLIQKFLQQKHQASAIHEANGENGSSNQFLQRILQQKLPTSAIRQTDGEDGSSRQVLLQQKPHVQTVANHQPNGEKRTSSQLLQKILQQIPHAQVAATHQTNGENGSSSQVLQKILQQNPQTSAIHQPHGELENGSLSQVLQKTLQLQHEPQLAFHESDELEANGNQMLLKTLQQEPQSSILQNNGEDRNQVLQTTLRGCNIGDSIQKCEATLQQLHIGAQYHERQPTLQHTLQGEQSTESPQHSDIGKSSQLLESILQQSYRSSGDGYQREINQLAYNGNSNGHIPHIGSGNVHQNLGMVPQPYSMIQNGSQAVHPIFQQSHDHMKNGDLKSRLDFQDHQSGMIHHSGLNQPAYQNGVCNQSQQTSINLTYDGDDNHNRRPSIVCEADIQYLQRMGQWMNPRTFSPDPSSPAKTSGFVGPKQETVDGVVMEGPGVKDFFGAGSDLVSPCFSSGLVNNVPLPTRTPHVAPGMCNSLLSRGPRDVWWNPPVLPTDGGTSGESASAQQTTAAFHQFENGYLPIAGLVTPISAPLPQMPSEHAPLFTDADVYGASPQSHLGSSSILPMPMASESQDQWVGPSPRTEPNTSPYITADLVSRMPSRVSGPVKTRFTDKTSRSFRIHQMQHVQHPGAVTAVDFFKPPRGPPGTYFPNNEASSPHATIASAKHVHEAVPDAPAAAIPLQNAQSLNFPPRPLTLQEALQLSPSETNFPLQNSSHFPMPLPPLLQSVTPASIQAAALGLSWPRASPIVPKLEISSPQDLFTTPGAAVLNALPTASLIKSGSVQPYFPAQPLAASSILNAPFPQVSHRRKEGSEPAAAVACNKIQGGVRAINLDSKDHQILKRMRAGDKRVRFEGDDEHHRQRKQRQQVGVLSSRAIATFDSKDVLQKQIAEEWRMFRRVTRKKLEGRNVEQNQSDTKELAIRKMNGFNHEREQHARKQRKRWKLLRRNGMIHRGIEELIKSASRQANVIVANHEVDKEGRKLLQRRNWLLGDVSNNADSEGNVEQKRQWMLVRIRLLQTLILWKKARYRARLLTHPLFPHLLKAHVDCIRVMTPACKIRDITMQLQRAQRFFEKFLRFAPRRPCEDSRRFDLYLKKFLVQMKNFQDHLECQLKLHATPTYSRLWRIERALFQMTGTRIPGRLESGPTMSDELEDGSDVDSVENISAAAARINYANIKRVIDTRYYGAYGPTVPDRAIMETIRREMVESLGLAHYRRKIREVREEILRKRRAGKLPEGTTNILRAWWEAHAKWPYPTRNEQLRKLACKEDEKELLIKKTGLELKQVNNWFINQRKRNWHNNPLATSNRDKRKYPLAELIQV